MARLLRDATTAERNAAFNAAHTELLKVISEWVPGFMQGQARDKLESAEGRTLVLDTVDAVLGAAEQVREQSEAKQAAKAPPHA